MTVAEAVAKIGELNAGYVFFWVCVIWSAWRLSDLIPEIVKLWLEHKRSGK